MTDSLVELAAETIRTSALMNQVRPKASELETFVGTESQMPFSVAYDADRYELYRNEEESSPTVSQLVGMRRTDGQARALYRLLTLPLRSALRTATFVPAEDGEDEAKFIDSMFTLPAAGGGMTVPFQRVMAQMIMSLFDGFSAFEQVYWVPTTGPLKGKLTLKKLAYRSSETVTFLTDEHGDFAGLRQRANLHGKYIDVAIDKENSFYVACQEEERPYFGVSLFQSAFNHYDKKIRLYFIAHLAAQRAAVGMREGTYPNSATNKEKADFRRALADIGVAQYITHGEGYKINLLTEAGSFDFLSYINHHNSQMSKSVLASFFDSNQGGGSSDTSLVNFGEQSDAMFIMMLTTIMDDLASSINNWLIPKFIDWNFGSGKYPTFTWGPFTDAQKESIKSTFDKLAPTSPQGVNVTPEFLFELEKKMADEMGLEIDYEAIAAEREELKAAQQAADSAAFGGGQGAPDPFAAAPTDAPAGDPGAAQGAVSEGEARLEADLPAAALSAPPGEPLTGHLSQSVGASLDEEARQALLTALEMAVDVEWGSDTAFELEDQDE